MKMHFLASTAFVLIAMGTYAHAGPTSTQSGPNSITKPNGDAGITAPIQEQPAAVREDDKPSTTPPSSAMTKPSSSSPDVVTKP